MAYITKSDIETYLSIDLSLEGVGVVESLIPAVEALIDRYCNRTWSTANETTDITEKFDGGNDTFFLQNTPINTIQSVTVDGQAMDAADIYNYGSYIRLSSRVASGMQNVVVVYRTSAHAANLPADVKQAMIQWVSELFKASQDAGKVAKDVQFGATKISYKVSADDMPDFVRRVLDMHVKISL